MGVHNTNFSWLKDKYFFKQKHHMVLNLSDMIMFMNNNKFTINFNEATEYGYTAIMSNYFVEEILKKQTDLKSKQIFFRLFRTAIIGDILFKKSKELCTNEDEAENQFLAALFESYMFLVRTIYDYMMHYMKEYGVNETSFNDLIKKIKKGGYPEIKGKLRKNINDSPFFDEIRSLRDSIKRQTPYIFVYVKNSEYRISGTIYKRDGSKEDFDETLYLKIFGYSTALLLLMSYIAENKTGVSLKDQFKYFKNTSK